MEQRQSERLYVISVGDSRDMTEGRSFYYYIEDKNGEKALPVFTARGGAEKYISNNLRDAKAHLDMLESVGAERAHILRKDVFVVGSAHIESVAEIAVGMGVDYLVRDPRPGDKQEILRLPK